MIRGQRPTQKKKKKKKKNYTIKRIKKNKNIKHENIKIRKCSICKQKEA